jgi:hypothetical protein
VRAVTAATAAAVLQVDQKTFDNLLLRIGPSANLAPGRQGVERRIPVALIEDLVLTRDLCAALGVSARDGFALARQLLGRDPLRPGLSADAGFVGSLHAGAFVQLGVDLAALHQTVQERLEAAIEAVVKRPRGRPARSSASLGDA